ncbi:MAG: helix-turn-helix domain-containing protein [Myxococcaceae bacterium]|nr:helix-turn-helix domain-containing protein [Myxococcaceae bacterium]MCI0668844.1 helix-turn-helix domain-containing protein [Myxococcaceae bacterium]
MSAVTQDGENGEREGGLLPEGRSDVVAASLAELGRAIRALREERGMTQEEFARASGISVSFASLLERGERSPSYDTLVQVAAALEVTLAQLLSGVPGTEAGEPGHGRLLEAARVWRLTRGQVDRLLVVAEALFRPLDEAEGPPRCTEPGCERPVLARGLCTAHYHRLRRAGR